MRGTMVKLLRLCLDLCRCRHHARGKDRETPSVFAAASWEGNVKAKFLIFFDRLKHRMGTRRAFVPVVLKEFSHSCAGVVSSITCWGVISSHILCCEEDYTSSAGRLLRTFVLCDLRTSSLQGMVAAKWNLAHGMYSLHLSAMALQFESHSFWDEHHSRWCSRRVRCCSRSPPSSWSKIILLDHMIVVLM